MLALHNKVDVTHTAFVRFVKGFPKYTNEPSLSEAAHF